MPKKTNQGILFSQSEYEMITAQDDKYIIPLTTKLISKDAYNSIQQKNNGYFLPKVSKTLTETDLPLIKKYLVEGLSRPQILDKLEITESSFNNFLQQHFSTKSIVKAKETANVELKLNEKTSN